MIQLSIIHFGRLDRSDVLVAKRRRQLDTSVALRQTQLIYKHRTRTAVLGGNDRIANGGILIRAEVFETAAAVTVEVMAKAPFPGISGFSGLSATFVMELEYRMTCADQTVEKRAEARDTIAAVLPIERCDELAELLTEKGCSAAAPPRQRGHEPKAITYAGCDQ